MTGKERVTALIEGRRPDRVPLYGWVKANLTDEIAAAFGSVDAFEDKYGFDLSHIFSRATPYASEVIETARESLGRNLEPSDLLDLPMTDAGDLSFYDSVRSELRHHSIERNRFTYVQTPGVFEHHNGYFGFENHLAYLLLFPDEIRELYRRLTEWVAIYASVCVDLGVDMIHVSDDWGSQNSLLFSPEVFRDLVFPFHFETVDHIHRLGVKASLHSDGNVNEALSGVVEIGYDVVHPYQESAGMSFNTYLSGYADKFTIMGGIDIQRDLGFGDPDRAIREIDRVLDICGDRGLILCTTHFVQNHCSIEELVAVFDHISATIT